MLVNRVRQTEEFHHQPNFMRRDYLQNGVISEVSETLLQQATQESVAEIENIITDLLKSANSCTPKRPGYGKNWMGI